MQDEGVIKFHCIRTEAQLLHDSDVASLEEVRAQLYSNDWIGMDANGIGYGNISLRWNSGFIISATQTGSLPALSKEDYVFVSQADIASNTVYCTGLKDASSESMTHAVLYAIDSAIQSVIHIHDLAMWERLKDRIPFIPAHIPYGTPEMAEAVATLYQSKKLNIQLFGMAGHTGGLVSFGKSPRETFIILQMYK
jgi:ribulose-5-phosphate 4-epimerase/fuculose-1-phosphate aldolase